MDERQKVNVCVQNRQKNGLRFNISPIITIVINNIIILLVDVTGH